jgi:hypothetical protein
MAVDRTNAAILLGVWAAVALDVYSTLNSSPQTTELFAGDREESLMHWVVIGDVVGLGAGLAASLIVGQPWPFIGTVVVVAGMHYAYTHAVKRGTGQHPPA